MEFLEIKNNIWKEYFTGWDWNRRLETIGKMISELEDGANEFIHSEAQKLKN